jgi:hypothetical protein
MFCRLVARCGVCSGQKMRPNLQIFLAVRYEPGWGGSTRFALSWFRITLDGLFLI